eukprot:SAG31_NODE_15406_length_756_cov_37.242009_1_plen_39_part_10
MVIVIFIIYVQYKIHDIYKMDFHGSQRRYFGSVLRQYQK